MTHTFPTAFELAQISDRPKFPVGAWFRDPKDSTFYRYVCAGGAFTAAARQMAGYQGWWGHVQGYVRAAGQNNGSAAFPVPAGAIAIGQYFFVVCRGTAPVPVAWGNTMNPGSGAYIRKLNGVANPAASQTPPGTTPIVADADTLFTGQNDGASKPASTDARWRISAI